MGKFRLAAFDMDGTLLNSDKRITQETKRAIRGATAAGRYIVLSTGRSVAECEDCAEDLGPIRYSVCESGALVYDRSEQKILHRKGFRKEISDEILRIGSRFDVMPHIISLGEALTERSDLDRIGYYRMGVYSAMLRRVCIALDGVSEKLIASDRGIEKINFYCASPEIRDELRDALDGIRDEITYAYAETSSIEISPKGMTKAAGLAWLCDYLQIDPSETIAAGDADNDRGMLEFAGLSAAMGNASDQVKGACDVVVRDNDHDGCCDVIRILMED